MVSLHRRVHPVTRRETLRGIVRRRYIWAGNLRNRIRVLTPAEINRRALNIDIESGIESVPPPLLRNPARFHGADSPTHKIIEHPLQSTSTSQNLHTTLNNSPRTPTTIPVDPLLPIDDSDDDRSTILLNNLDWIEDFDITEYPLRIWATSV